MSLRHVGVGALALTAMFAVFVAAHDYWVNSVPTVADFHVLACTAPTGGLVPIGVSEDIKIRPNYYWVRDKHGDWQSYRPNAFESCATLSLEDARSKGMIQ